MIILRASVLTMDDIAGGEKGASKNGMGDMYGYTVCGIGVRKTGVVGAMSPAYTIPG
jgi:hypothetical protein